MARLFAAKGGNSWSYLPEWFGREYVSIPEMTHYLGEYFFRLKRNMQESMSAWARREEKVYLRMTQALARPEQMADSTEPDWNLLHERQQKWSK